jgi:hypothetical protein
MCTTHHIEQMMDGNQLQSRNSTTTIPVEREKRLHDVLTTSPSEYSFFTDAFYQSSGHSIRNIALFVGFVRILGHNDVRRGVCAKAGAEISQRLSIPPAQNAISFARRFELSANRWDVIASLEYT